MSGISGYLRQELRELEILDDITCLRFEGVLPQRVTGLYRRPLLRAYQVWKGENFELASLHDAIRWRPHMGPRIPVDVSYSPWHPTVPLAKNVSKATVATGVKQKISDLAVQPEVTKKRLVDPEVAGPGRSPLHGVRWDSADFSCAYDSLFTIIYNIWAEDTV
ncbi:hypothetical protein C8J57DRAFT_1086927 [Mycena rebaudengoi]|nr:hypothetical protein C8J57DRAFT_1086927 [Mycena rebaudengoi]